MAFVAALRHDGITAPWVIDGPITGGIFRTSVEAVLAATLLQGDIVILDNLGSHKVPAIQNATRAAGARLFYLPAYSRDLNPIEQVFWRRIGSLFDQFSPQEGANHLRNSGYGSG